MRIPIIIYFYASPYNTILHFISMELQNVAFNLIWKKCLPRLEESKMRWMCIINQQMGTDQFLDHKSFIIIHLIADWGFLPTLKMPPTYGKKITAWKYALKIWSVYNAIGIIIVYESGKRFLKNLALADIKNEFL